MERKQPPPILHYLSNYEKSKAFTEDCELRVKSINKQDKERANSLSLDQKLEYYLSVLKEEILKRESGITPENIDIIRKTTVRWMNAPGVRAFRDLIYKQQRSNHEMNKFDNLSIIFDDYVNEIESFGDDFPITSFSIVTHKRIASDIWLHLLSAKAGRNFTFLFCIALCLLSERLSSASKQRILHQFELYFLVVIEGLIKVHKRKTELLTFELHNTHIGPPYALSRSTYLKTCIRDML